MNVARSLPVWFAVAAALSAQDVRVLVADAAAEPAHRCAALGELQDRGELDVPTLLAALGGNCVPLQATAVAILRHEWRQWPDALFVGLQQSSVAAHVVLEELAMAPRPVADEWVTHQAATASDAATRLLALAARAAAPDRKEAEFAVRALATADRDAAAAVVVRLDAARADGLVGVLHGLLAGGTPCAAMQPLLSRLSDMGCRQLLGLMATLPIEIACDLAAELARRDDPRLRERMRAAVDGELPLDRPLLRHCGPLLDTPARRTRVAAVMADGSRPLADRLAAFESVLESRSYVVELRAFCDEGGSQRWRRVFAAGLAGIPEKVVLDILGDSPETAGVVLSALPPQALTPAVNDRLAEVIESLMSAGGRSRGLAGSVLTTLAAGGDEAVNTALRLARPDPLLLRGLYEQLGRRHDPVGIAALAQEAAQLASGREDADIAELRDHVALAMAENHDRREIERLFAALPRRGAAFARRCRHALPELKPAHWQQVLAAFAAVDAETRLELLQWLAACPLPAARERLRATWGGAFEIEEEREAALQSLLAGDERNEMLRRWRTDAFTSEVDDDLFAFGAIATMPAVPGDDDVALMQWLLFDAGRRDPREQERARGFPDGRSGFPVVAAIACWLRQHPDLADRVAAPAATLASTGKVDGLARQRLLFLWTGLQADRELMARVAAATASLALAIPDAGDAGEGAAQRWFAVWLEHRGKYGDAAVAARAAIAHLLRLPHDALAARIHLGVRDPDAGMDPHAALAAMPYLFAARAALAQSDRATAQSALAAATEFAGRDASTHATITELLRECR